VNRATHLPKPNGRAYCGTHSTRTTTNVAEVTCRSCLERRRQHLERQARQGGGEVRE
jgi:hypothetical protein